MMMEESVQHVVMTAIQEVWSPCPQRSCSICASRHVDPAKVTSSAFFLQLMSKETPVTMGNDSYVDLDRQVSN